MKTIYLFAYCNGGLHCKVRFFKLPVGVSQRDQKALRFLRDLQKSAGASVLMERYDSRWAEFLCNVARSLFPAASLSDSLSALQVQFAPVTAMACFLKNSPLALLNSDFLCPTLTPARRKPY